MQPQLIDPNGTLRRNPPDRVRRYEKVLRLEEEYQQELDEFERRHAQVLGVSVDSLYSHGAWAAVRGIEFPLLADFHPKSEAARRYHVYRDEAKVPS